MRSIRCITTDTEYKSVAAAVKATGISKDRLYYCLKHHKKWIDGTAWEYAETINGITGECENGDKDFNR